MNKDELANFKVEVPEHYMPKPKKELGCPLCEAGYPKVPYDPKKHARWGFHESIQRSV